MMMTTRTSAGNTIFFTSASPVKTGRKSAGKGGKHSVRFPGKQLKKPYYSIVNARKKIYLIYEKQQ